METKLITYNLNDRDRVYLGAKRETQWFFKPDRIVAAINSPECQERVEKGDMKGYLGHLVREKYGMRPREGIRDPNKPETIILPALKTTYLKAYKDGTVEHKAEFLNNVYGQAAYAMHDSKVGGFSHAIDVKNPDKPVFYGEDYVDEPNYHRNRGYLLDSIDDEELFLLEQNSQLAGLLKVIEQKNKLLRQASIVLDSLESENAELISQLADKNAVLDSVDKFERPLILDTTRKTQIERDVAAFRNAKLPRFSATDSNSEMERYLEFQQRLK